ncbi:MAG: DUF3810 domain-containing protein [Lachnospiraceae bacterium]|nr:DUF3810 domain-containing protein [Lachnospiraceae bacterium]
MMILFSVLLNIISRIWKGFSNFYVNQIFPVWVETYGRLTGLFPFSVGEWMLYLAVLLVFALAAGGILLLIMRRKLSEGYKRGYKRYAFFIYWVFGIVCVIMTLNCFLLYQASPISERYEIGGSRDKEYGAAEIAALRDYVVVKANELAPFFERDARGYLIAPGNMEEEAVRQMQRLGERFENLQGYYPYPKKLFLSGFYSQQYIMGYYFPFSMEANYNRQMYVTNTPVTMCHELSHLKGFILEDEANFIGYLACVDAEDPLFRYSAYLSVIGYLDRDFIKAIGEDAEIYLEHPQISQQVADDKMFLTNESWEQVERRAVLSTETVRQAADTFLDTTLTLNGVTDGTVSYSRVVRLLLQYYDGILY